MKGMIVNQLDIHFLSFRDGSSGNSFSATKGKQFDLLQGYGARTELR